MIWLTVFLSRNFVGKQWYGDNWSIRIYYLSMEFAQISLLHELLWFRRGWKMGISFNLWNATLAGHGYTLFVPHRPDFNSQPFNIVDQRRSLWDLISSYVQSSDHSWWHSWGMFYRISSTRSLIVEGEYSCKWKGTVCSRRFRPNGCCRISWIGYVDD